MGRHQEVVVRPVFFPRRSRAVVIRVPRLFKARSQVHMKSRRNGATPYREVRGLRRTCNSLLGIALGGSGLLIVLRNSDKEAQRLIHCVGVWEDIRDVRLQPDNVAKSLAPRTELPNPQVSQIILRPKIFYF